MFNLGSSYFHVPLTVHRVANFRSANMRPVVTVVALYHRTSRSDVGSRAASARRHADVYSLYLPTWRTSYWRRPDVVVFTRVVFVCLSACPAIGYRLSTQPWSLQKRPKRSTCHLGIMEIRGPRMHVLEGDREILAPRKGPILTHDRHQTPIPVSAWLPFPYPIVNSTIVDLPT